MKYDGIATAMATITTTVGGGEVELGGTMGGFKKNRVRVFEGQGQACRREPSAPHPVAPEWHHAGIRRHHGRRDQQPEPGLHLQREHLRQLRARVQHRVHPAADVDIDRALDVKLPADGRPVGAAALPGRRGLRPGWD